MTGKRRRLTAISGTVLGTGAGFAWETWPSDADFAQVLFTELADRRVLFNPCSWEEPEHCVQSAIELRHHLTAMLSQLPAKSELRPVVEHLRAACRTFCDEMRPGQGPAFLPPHFSTNCMTRAALARLRQGFSAALQGLPERYQIAPEHQIAELLRDPRATMW